MNDSSVSVSDIRTVLNQQAYVLFYIKCIDVKKTGDYSHLNHNAGISGQSSPRPVVIPRTIATMHHNSVGFIGPQLPPHMNKISGSNHGSLTSTAPVANGIGRDHSQPNKDASSQASSSQSIHPAANESQDFSTPVTRAKTPSEPLPHCTESSAVSASPSATATTTPSVAAKESASALSSSGQDGNPAALPPQPGCSQSTSGASAAPQKVSVSKDEAKDLPQDKCATTGTEGRKDTKEQYQSKPSSSCNEKRSSRDRQRLYSSSGRDRERHNRDRSHERESDDDRHWYRRDYKEGNFSPSTAPETNKFKGSPPRARLSSPDKEDQNRKRTLSKDRDDSSEARHTKKHKKSKKKKKSKDKDRHRESGSEPQKQKQRGRGELQATPL